MKLKMIPLAGLALAMMGGGALAQSSPQSTNMNVGVEVEESCTVAVDTGLTFPAITSWTSATDGTGRVLVTCGTYATPFRISVGAGVDPGNGGLQRRMRSGANYINYDLYNDAGRTTEPFTVSNPVTDYPHVTPAGAATLLVNIYGRVPAGQNSPPGNYSDTVSVTITF